MMSKQSKTWEDKKINLLDYSSAYLLETESNKTNNSGSEKNRGSRAVIA